MPRSDGKNSLALGAGLQVSEPRILPAHGRVSVLVDSRVVPLFPGKPATDTTSSPWSGLTMERQRHEAIFIPKHEHRTFCLHLQTSSGSVAMDWNSFGKSGRTEARAGNLMLLSPGTEDSLLWHGPSERIITSIDPLLLRRAADELEVRGAFEFENRWSFQDDQLRLLLTEMDRETNSGWPMGSLYGDLLGMSLSIALLKKYAHTSTVAVLLKGGLTQHSLKRIEEFVEENLHRDIRLQEMASVAGISMFHYARSFRESTGFTPHQFVVERRIERAKTLLRLPEWSMEQIASACGFAGGSPFSKTFRKNTGVAPSEWRKRGFP